LITSRCCRLVSDQLPILFSSMLDGMADAGHEISAIPQFVTTP
jgi:hypothetical protein